MSGQRRECNFLTETGLYEVLMQSRKPIEQMDASIPFTGWGAKLLNNLHKFMMEYFAVSNYLSTFAAYFTFSKAALNRKHNPLRYFYTPSVHISVSYPRVEC